MNTHARRVPTSIPWSLSFQCILQCVSLPWVGWGITARNLWSQSVCWSRDYISRDIFSQRRRRHHLSSSLAKRLKHLKGKSASGQFSQYLNSQISLNCKKRQSRLCSLKPVANYWEESHRHLYAVFKHEEQEERLRNGRTTTSKVFFRMMMIISQLENLLPLHFTTHLLLHLLKKDSKRKRTVIYVSVSAFPFECLWISTPSSSLQELKLVTTSIPWIRVL